jgi:plasmid maintenance system antidote protein VapI
MPTELPITDVLRDAIVQSGTAYRELERASGVKRQSLMKFVRREQTLRLDMADKLATYFGLQLTPNRKTNRKSK